MLGVGPHERKNGHAVYAEKCCYGREEMAVLNMVKKDLFGELIHCQCGYEHDLRSEISQGEENRHYRLNNFVHRNGDLYPTHGLGPIAKMLDINKGNRFISLVAMSSKARGLHQYAVITSAPNTPSLIPSLIKATSRPR